MNKIMLSKH